MLIALANEHIKGTQKWNNLNLLIILYSHKFLHHSFVNSIKKYKISILQREICTWASTQHQILGLFLRILVTLANQNLLKLPRLTMALSEDNTLPD